MYHYAYRYNTEWMRFEQTFCEMKCNNEQRINLVDINIA